MYLQSALAHARRRVVKHARRLVFGRPRNPIRECLRAAGPIELVVHVGAHVGQETRTYRALGVRNVVWIEGDPDTYRLLCDRIRAERQSGRRINHHPICALVSDADHETVEFHRFNNKGASSSIHKPTERLRTEWPGLDATGEPLKLRTRRLETILDEVAIDWPAASKSLLVLDVQGHEAAVLAGLGRYAAKFDLCECEISKEAIYEGGALYSEIKAVFDGMGFGLVSHAEDELPWHGDVIFRRLDANRG